jgi:transcription termination/antitermination protein NusG
VTDELNNLMGQPHDEPKAAAGEAVGGQVHEPSPPAAVVMAEAPSEQPIAAPPVEAPVDSAAAESPREERAAVPGEQQAGGRDVEVPAEQPVAEEPVEAAVAPPVQLAAAETPGEEPAPEVVAEVVPPAPEPAPVEAVAVEAESQPSPPGEEPKSENMDWYILKVQSNREESIREGLLRRVAIAGLGRYFGEVIVPTEKVTEFKGGKKRVTKRKLYPGYLVVHMEINDDTWFLARETPGIGDFTGAAGRPSPMLPHEVARIVAKQEEKSEKAPKLKIGFKPGDQVKINEGTFENFEGEVSNIDETNGRVTVMINIFGRSTPVELEYWQIGAV